MTSADAGQIRTCCVWPYQVLRLTIGSASASVAIGTTRANQLYGACCLAEQLAATARSSQPCYGFLSHLNCRVVAFWG